MNLEMIWGIKMTGKLPSGAMPFTDKITIRVEKIENDVYGNQENVGLKTKVKRIFEELDKRAEVKINDDKETVRIRATYIAKIENIEKMVWAIFSTLIVTILGLVAKFLFDWWKG